MYLLFLNERNFVPLIFDIRTKQSVGVRRTHSLVTYDEVVDFATNSVFFKRMNLRPNSHPQVECERKHESESEERSEKRPRT